MGTPLTDADRLPGARTIAGEIDGWRARHEIRRARQLRVEAWSYRDIIIGDPALGRILRWSTSKRITTLSTGARPRGTKHFMPIALLDSQFATLREPTPVSEHPLHSRCRRPANRDLATEIVHQLEERQAGSQSNKSLSGGRGTMTSRFHPGFWCPATPPSTRRIPKLRWGIESVLLGVGVLTKLFRPDQSVGGRATDPAQLGLTMANGGLAVQRILLVHTLLQDANRNDPRPLRRHMGQSDQHVSLISLSAATAFAGRSSTVSSAPASPAGRRGGTGLPCKFEATGYWFSTPGKGALRHRSSMPLQRGFSM